MSAASGIGISKELSDTFADAVNGNNVRFIKVAIENESLVPNGITDAQGQFLEDDFDKLQDILEDNIPGYVLARIDSRKDTGWLVITYVPNTASVREKTLYAATRSALTKSLGSAHFPDSIFATSKAELTSKEYATHKAHASAPPPLSGREKEIADALAAERSSEGAYDGIGARRNHILTPVGLKWSGEAEQAVKHLGEGNGSVLVLLSIDDAESLVLLSSSDCEVEELAERIPASEPSFAFYAWSHRHATSSSPRRDIVFVYACPSSSPVKKRMLFSSSARALYYVAKPLLAPLPSSSSSALIDRKIETSDPSELTEAFLISKLELSSDVPAGSEASSTRMGGEARGFARPKGPGRKR